MANAFNNLRGLVRDLRAVRAAAEGDTAAAELLDAWRDELDMHLDIGCEDDGGGDVGHDEGGEDPEDVVAENAVDVPRGTRESVAGADPAHRRVSSVRGGTRAAVLTDRNTVDRRVIGGKRRG